MAKYVRCEYQHKVYYGILQQDSVQFLQGDYTSAADLSTAPVSLANVCMLAPVMPGKIIAVGKNYLDHIKEFDGEEPQSIIIFSKPPSSVIGPGDQVILPEISKRVDYEGELAFVIKKPARFVKKEGAADYILGYTCLNDVTARDLQYQDGQWVRGKGFDTFCPIGPIITDEIDPDNAEIQTTVNGVVVQNSNTRHMKWNAAAILEFVSECMTLMPGDVITTGTPAGVGPLSDGDHVAVTIAGIGTLENSVSAMRE